MQPSENIPVEAVEERWCLAQSERLNLTEECICSAQSKNRYNSGIALHKEGIPTLPADSGIVSDNSRITQGIYIVLSSDIICAQNRNRVG